MYKTLYINNGINYLSTGAGFLASTVALEKEPLIFERKGLSSNHHFCRSELLNFGGGGIYIPLRVLHVSFLVSRSPEPLAVPVIYIGSTPHPVTVANECL